jgi:hypothetical protein
MNKPGFALFRDPPAGLSLSPRGLQDERLVVLSDASVAEFWRSHPPWALTPAAAGEIALLETAEAASGWFRDG